MPQTATTPKDKKTPDLKTKIGGTKTYNDKKKTASQKAELRKVNKMRPKEADIN